MNFVDFREIEEKWLKKWEDTKIFKAENFSKMPKFYVLEMFPYPSGYAAHMGHARNYIIGDSFVRFKRRDGFNVLYPMGWDALGLPAENEAIEKGTHPKESTEKNIETLKKQMKMLGISYDWCREISTCRPEYYQWNQFFFLKFLEKGLVYKKKTLANWCPGCKTVLANEQVEEGKCWRCESEVMQKELEQWFFRTTKYADELLEGLEELGWSDRLKTMQRNWIGKSYGTEVFFKVKESGEVISTFTTRPDTIYGITYMVIAPEHTIVDKLVKDSKYEKDVESFKEKVKKMTELQRTAAVKEKNGLFIGHYLINPVNGDEIPIYIADYVVPSYGTGAVMGVPAHDQRDFEFAKKYGLPIKVVIQPPEKHLKSEDLKEAYVEEGLLINSGQFNGMNNTKAIEKISEYLEEKCWGKKTVYYKIRDWCVSRQRYWGTPIPVVYCGNCGMQPVPENELPVLLPLEVDFQRLKEEVSPLATNKDFVNATCPKCRGPAKREIETMDTFVDSSWYFLRFTDPKNSEFAFNPKLVEYWLPVDQYIGGIEHAVMHLIYARFFVKALRDLGYLKFNEPFSRLMNQGMVLKGGIKMSKSKHNTVDPRDVIQKYGTDVLRTYLLLMANPDKAMEWSDKGIKGTARFVNKFWNLVLKNSEKIKNNTKLPKNIKCRKNRVLVSRLQKTIKNVTDNLNNFELNIALLNIKSLINEIHDFKFADDEESIMVLGNSISTVLNLLAPFAPFISEELWEKLGNKSFISTEPWPKPNEKFIDEKTEAGEELVKQTLNDIKEILKLIKKKPKEIYVFVAPQWKFDVLKKIKTKEKKNTNELIKELMCDKKLRLYGKELVNFINKAVGEEINVLLGCKEEYGALKEEKNFFEKEIGCRIEIEFAEIWKIEKAKQARPMKPAIYVE